MIRQKIYFIRANQTRFGGAEVYLSRLSKALSEKDILHDVVHSGLPKFLPSWLRVILFNLRVCLTKNKKIYFSLDRISCPDIYRAGDGVHKVFLKTAGKSKLNPLHLVYLFLEKRCFQNAKCIIANSNMIRNEIICTYRVDPNKVRVIYNGVESKPFNYSQSFDKLSREFRVEQDDQVLLYVGSGFKRKGVLEFLQIVAQLDSDIVRAFVVGKDKNIAFYREKSIELGIDDRVIFTGPRVDVDDFYTISDIFILPTYYEPFSNAVLEAMSFENVVITTQQNGVSEIISDEFVMKNSVDMKIVKTIKAMLVDKQRMDAAKTANRQIAELYSIDANVTHTLETVRELLAFE